MTTLVISLQLITPKGNVGLGLVFRFFFATLIKIKKLKPFVYKNIHLL